MNGNCSALQFSSRFGVCTQGLVPKQALGHLCNPQGISMVQNACPVLSFCLSRLYRLTSLLSTPSTSDRNHPEENARASDSLAGSSQAAISTTWGPVFTQSPNLAKTRTNCLVLLLFNVNCQNCHTSLGGETETCSSHSRHLGST